MLTHIVLFRMADPADINEAIARLRALPETVAEIRGMEVGRNVVTSERAYDYAIIVRLASLATLNVYANHPDHLALLDWMRPRLASSVAVDFES